MLLNPTFCQTPIPKITKSTWVQGAPTPVAQGSMSPNEQAMTLLAGFASGSVEFGDSLKHLPTILVTSKGKGIKNIKIKQGKKQDIDSCTTDMARTKCTKTKEEHE